MPWLPGYENSAPVRIGNAAVDQIQLDIYGEIAETLFAARQMGLGPIDKPASSCPLCMEHLESIWQSLGQRHLGDARAAARLHPLARHVLGGVRPGGEDWPSSSAWRARPNAGERCATRSMPKSARRASTQRSEHLHPVLWRQDARREPAADAPVGFLPPDDPRIIGTIKAVEEELLRDGFVRRYATDDVDDGVGGDEGAFLACSFWLVDAYMLSGRRDDAVEMFDRLLSLRTPLGLLAEEYDAVRKRLVGNFPQGFSHLGLINSAHKLAGTDGMSQERRTSRRPPASALPPASASRSSAPSESSSSDSASGPISGTTCTSPDRK